MKRLTPSSDDVRTSVFLVDDNLVIREGLRVLLGGQSDIEVIGHASLGPGAVEDIIRACPDVVVIMLDKAIKGLELVREVLRRDPAVQAIVISVSVVFEEVFRLLRSGVKGYVVTESVDREIGQAIRRVRSGKRYLSSSISKALVDDYVTKTSLSARTRDPLLSLTIREKEILQLVVEGKGSAAVADTLNLSVSTVNTYRCRMMKKLGLRSLPELVRFAIGNGLTPLSSWKKEEHPSA